MKTKSPKESLLRSLSHDLKEPIRSIRRRIIIINNLIENAALDNIDIDNTLKVNIKSLDLKLTQIGDEIKNFRSNAEVNSVTFQKIEDFMEDLLRTRVKDYISLVRLINSSTRSKSLKTEIKVVAENSRRLKRRVLSLQNYAKARGKLILNHFGLHREIEKVKQELEFLIESNNAKIFREGEANIVADQIKIAQVFQNLIENSIKYAKLGTPPIINIYIERFGYSDFGRKTLFKFEEEGMQDGIFKTFIKVTFSDNGIGIPTENINRVFEMFYRGIDEDEDEYQGKKEDSSGLGLSIVKTIIEAHAGIVWAESAENNGTKVFFILPN